MTDFLQRLNRLLPRAHAWVAATHTEYAAQAISVADAGFPRLASYFPDSVLRATRVVRVKKIPFPPFATSGGLPELAPLEQMPMSAILFTDVIFVHADAATESTHFHELCHAVQAATLGMNDYLRSYVVEFVRNGYAKNPFEVSVFDLQSQFDRGVPIPDAVGTLQADARRARELAAGFFRENGVEME